MADTHNNRIQIVQPSGQWVGFIGSLGLDASGNPISGSGNCQFNTPSAVAIDLSGNYVIADSGNNRIQVISPSGVFIRQFGSGGSTVGDGTLLYPTGVAVDLSGNYLVADSGNNLIQIFTPSGQFYSELGSVSLTSSNGSLPGPFSSPQGVAVDKTGKYIVVDSVNNRIMAFNV